MIFVSVLGGLTPTVPASAATWADALAGTCSEFNFLSICAIVIAYNSESTRIHEHRLVLLYIFIVDNHAKRVSDCHRLNNNNYQNRSYTSDAWNSNFANLSAFLFGFTSARLCKGTRDNQPERLQISNTSAPFNSTWVAIKRFGLSALRYKNSFGNKEIPSSI